MRERESVGDAVRELVTGWVSDEVGECVWWKT